ncbi:MAG TPA: hypothetical protein PK250_05815 [Syntrophobacter fumaroxidans]|nr:hypothetical protein [Syntrophobacter fumaroxidans]
MATVLLLFAMSGWAWVAFTFALLDTLPVAVGFTTISTVVIPS